MSESANGLVAPPVRPIFNTTRLVLSACLTELGWPAHAEPRLRVEDGQEC